MLSTLMLVGLGFLSASLIALLIAPYIWRRAVKVTARRMSFGTADSASEVQAGRDQLRAEHALTTRKLELQLDDVKQKMADQAVEMSQITDHNEQLLNEVERQRVDIGARDGEIEQLRANMSPMESQLGSRSSTVQELRETIRRLEQKVHEQDMMVQQTIKAAELKGTEVEALVENAKTQAAFDPVLALNLSSSRVALNDQLDSLSVLSNDMEEQHREILAQQARVTKMKEDMARSTSVSADEAKNFQAQVTSLEAQRSKLGVDIAEATSEAARLSGEIVQLDSAWQNRDNPFGELRRRIEAVAGNVERVAKAINRESIVKSVLAALPGGKSAQEDGPAPEEQPRQEFPPAIEAAPPAEIAAPAPPPQIVAATAEEPVRRPDVAAAEPAPRPAPNLHAASQGDPGTGGRLKPCRRRRPRETRRPPCPRSCSSMRSSRGPVPTRPSPSRKSPRPTAPRKAPAPAGSCRLPNASVRFRTRPTEASERRPCGHGQRASMRPANRTLTPISRPSDGHVTVSHGVMTCTGDR